MLAPGRTGVATSKRSQKYRKSSTRGCAVSIYFIVFRLVPWSNQTAAVLCQEIRLLQDIDEGNVEKSWGQKLQKPTNSWQVLKKHKSCIFMILCSVVWVCIVCLCVIGLKKTSSCGSIFELKLDWSLAHAAWNYYVRTSLIQITTWFRHSCHNAWRSPHPYAFRNPCFSCPSDGVRLQYRMEHAENGAACASWSEEVLPASHIGCSIHRLEVMNQKAPNLGTANNFWITHQIWQKHVMRVKTSCFLKHHVILVKQSKLISDGKIIPWWNIMSFSVTCYHWSFKKKTPKSNVSHEKNPPTFHYTG